MFDHRKIMMCLLFATALLFAAGASAKSNGVMPSNKTSDKISQVENNAESLMQNLESRGFAVTRGYFKLWRAEDCPYTFDRMGICFGNNPAAPYVVPVLEAWPNEYVDPVTSNLWGPSEPGYPEYIDVYRFDPREAVVILGLLPPPAAYFSEQTYLFSRKGKFDKDSETYNEIAESLPYFFPFFFAKVPTKPERIEAFSTISNPINNVVIENQSGAAFDQLRYFIITPDQLMDQAVREAFSEISVKKEDIFTEQIPSDMNVGLDRNSDDFSIFIRYSQPKDGGETGSPSDIWRNELPMIVLRVRDIRSDPKPVEYPPFVFDDLEKRTAIDEWWLEGDLNNLLYAVSRKWEQPCSNSNCSDRSETFLDLQTSPLNVVGPLCNQIGENCAGDNWDTAYQLYGPLAIDGGEIYAVAGTLGTETGNATYVGLGINQVSTFNGVANLSDKDLEGTANAYKRQVHNTNKFFLYYFTRDCSDLKDLTGGCCFQLKDYIPPGDKFTLTIRDYIVPGTQRGPDSRHVLPSKVLTLNKPVGLK